MKAHSAFILAGFHFISVNRMVSQSSPWISSSQSVEIHGPTSKESDGKSEQKRINQNSIYQAVEEEALSV